MLEVGNVFKYINKSYEYIQSFASGLHKFKALLKGNMEAHGSTREDKQKREALAKENTSVRVPRAETRLTVYHSPLSKVDVFVEIRECFWNEVECE
jgi:hypothetical protein